MSNKSLFYYYYFIVESTVTGLTLVLWILDTLASEDVESMAGDFDVAEESLAVWIKGWLEAVGVDFANAVDLVWPEASVLCVEGEVVAVFILLADLAETGDVSLGDNSDVTDTVGELDVGLIWDWGFDLGVEFKLFPLPGWDVTTLPVIE